MIMPLNHYHKLGDHKASNVLDKDLFFRVLRRERYKADRANDCFSLVSFEVGDPESDGSPFDLLMEIMEFRLRATDEVGWLDKRHIGFLLSNTPYRGAWIFANNVLKVLMKHTEAITGFVIYVYPTNLEEEGEDKKDSDGNSSHLTSGTPDDLRVSEDTAFSGRSFQPTIIAAEYSKRKGKALHPVFMDNLPPTKRMLDLMVGIPMVIALSPIFLFAAVLIKLVSKGPIFFKQERVGYLGVVFTLYKFRSMEILANREELRKYMAALIRGEMRDQPMLKQEMNLIRCGGFLRKTGIDELPQLWNVLRGEMSLVGPRPPIPYESREYIRWYNGRFEVKPGLTGLWQVGKKNRLSFEEMIRIDLQYAKHYNLLMDLKIIFMTPLTILYRFFKRSNTLPSELK
jgi:lipopolysaccharide/colanic/teichoic acid biosynthesis glycosyltransferase